MSGTITVPLASIPTLQQRLADAESAYHDVMIGKQVTIASYGQGDGSKMVTFNRSSAPALLAYIATLRRQCGVRTRAPIIPSFR